MAEKRIVVDLIIATCKGCRTERTFYPDKELIGAEALIQWMQTQLSPCNCGATTCDIKARMKD